LTLFITYKYLNPYRYALCKHFNDQRERNKDGNFHLTFINIRPEEHFKNYLLELVVVINFISSVHINFFIFFNLNNNFTDNTYHARQKFILIYRNGWFSKWHIIGILMVYYSQIRKICNIKWSKIHTTLRQTKDNK
jgi:hypothetical protein